MTTSHSIESTTRQFTWAAVVLLAATTAACGGSTQSLAGTAPSQVSSLAAPSGGGSFGLMKDGKEKGRPAPDIGTTPTTDADDPETDGGESGHGHGHGKAAIQIEGFTKSISGDCTTGLIIVFNDETTVTTVKSENLTTEFQRATCEALLAAAETPVHLHIAATMQDDDTLVAIYVRMQGPKGDDDDGDEEEATTPTTTTN
jgi:hypothetical protein